MFNDNNFFGKVAGGGGFYDYAIDGSLRFNDDDSAYLSRTPASAGNRKTWTWSAWVKLGAISGTRPLFAVYIGSGSTDNQFFSLFVDGAALRASGYSTAYLTSSAFYRDPSAWYHVVCAVDTTNATANNRIRFYVNGDEITDFSARNNPSLNADLGINQAAKHELGQNGGFGSYYDGYMAEVNFIDGTALDATSFGEFKSGVWIPKAYSGSYGTNGFYLPLTSDANDDSGNGNNFTANNLASTDYVLDSPTNNFATLNPLNVGANSATYAEGNLKVSSSSSNGIGGSSTIQIPSTGKWYAEFYYVSSSNLEAAMLGISPLASATRTYDWDETGSLGYYSGNGNKYIDGSGTAYGSSYTDGDVISILANSDSGEATYYKNGVSQGVIAFDPADKFFYAGDGHGTTSITWVANFGQDSSFAGNKTAQGNTDDNGYGDFYYAPPSGYLALCTANLPDPVESIDPAQDGSPQDHFNTVLYTGTGSTQSITGVGFQPDWTWIKRRSTSSNHFLADAVTGANKELNTNTTSAQATNTNGITSFNTDGFSVGADGGVNLSGGTFVGWNWKANGSGVSNTDGSITSTVSANTDAGFSIVSWTTTGDSTETIGHGLSQAPTCIISKRRSGTTPWIIYHDGAGTTNAGFKFDTTAAHPTSYYYVTAPTSSVFTQSNSSYANYPSGNTCIAYCFHSVEGFSKFGSYTGNGGSGTSGTFVYTGFAPAFVIAKRAVGGIGHWRVMDIKRGINGAAYFNANESVAEGTSDFIDFHSNGFQLNDGTDISTNASGSTYIYMAFAENPFKYSTAR